MSEFDVGNCNESCRYSKNVDANICEKCAETNNMPYKQCCLEFCGEIEFCRGCKRGICKD